MFKRNCAVFLLRKFSGLEVQLRCKSDTRRQSNMLRKLMTGKRKEVFKWPDPHMVKKPEKLFGSEQKPSKITTRRATILNKMFMRHVTDVIANSASGHELSGQGLEITSVKVCQHYHGLNIFWTATNTSDFDALEQKLESMKKSVRNEMHRMQLMGNIPYITFVRDYQLTYFDELNAAIAKADYGDDFERNDGKTRKDSFEKQVDSMPAADEPEMRQDVFGLDHALIMGRIKQNMAKSKQAWKAFEEKKLNPTPSVPFSLITSFESIRQGQVNEKQSQNVLKEFLQKRKLAQKLKRQEQSKLNSSIDDEEDDEVYEYDDRDADHTDLNDEEDTEVYKFYDEHEPFDK